MKKYILLLTMFFICNHIWAQPPNFVWAKAISQAASGISGVHSSSIALDASGNVYTTGSFLGTVDFDPGAGTFNLTSSSSGYSDVFISKLDAAGNFVWAKAMGGYDPDDAFSITLDASGNVYTTGYFYGPADFDPGAGTFNLTSLGIGLTMDIFISKLDAAGNFLWAKAMGGGADDYGSSIALDGSGNVYTTGAFGGTGDFDPGAGVANLTASAGIFDNGEVFISKLDAAGNFVWAKAMGGTGIDVSSSIALDASGNVYTTGYFGGPAADFNPGVGIFNLTSLGGGTFISKLDAAGNFVWAKAMINAAELESSTSITLDASGNVYTTGHFWRTVDFDPGAGTFNLTSAGYGDNFIHKLDAAGNFVWAKAMEGTFNENSFAIALDASGNVYTTGSFQNTVDFDPGAGTFNLTSLGLGFVADIFISKLDTAGNFVWAKSMGGANGDGGSSIALDASGNVYTTGSFYGPADFDPGAGTFNLSGRGAFVQRLGYCLAPPTTPGAISGNTIICSGSTNTYSITEVSGATSYTWTLPSGWTGSSTTNSIITTASSADGTISVTANNSCGSSAAQILAVTVTPVLVPTIGIVAAPAGAICAGTNVTFTANITNGGASPEYQWLVNGVNIGTNSNAFSSNVLNNGDVVTCVLTSNDPCASPTMATSNTIVTVANANPTVNLGADVVQENPPATLDASAGFTAYLWSTTALTQTISVSASGQYIVTVTNIFGCTASDTIQVDFTSGIINQNGTATIISLYPNPTSNGVFNVSIQNIETSTMVLEIMDMKGSMIHNKYIGSVCGNLIEPFNLTDLKMGTYVMRITANGKSMQLSFIISS